MCRAWSGRETHFDARGTRFRIRMPLTLKTRHGPVQRGRKVYRTFPHKRHIKRGFDGDSHNDM